MSSSSILKRRQLWKVNGESRIWNNYPTKPTPDTLSRLFIIESEDINKYKFVCSSFNIDGNKLVTIDQRGNIFEFDFKTFKCEIVDRCGISANSICYSPKYDDITVGLNNQNIHIYECGTYKLCVTIKTSHQNPITRLQYFYINNSSKLILMSCSSDIIIVWDINNNYQQIQSLAHDYSITFGLISSEYECIATCFSNDMISFWDWNTYKEKYQLFYSNKNLLKEKIGHKRFKLICGDIDNKNGLLIVGGRSRCIYLWIIKQQLLLKCIVLPITIKHVIQLKFLENNGTILALGDDGQIVAINHQTLNIKFYIQRQSQFIESFSVSSNDKKIACVLSDGTVETMNIKSLCENHKKSHGSLKTQNSTLQPAKLSSLDLSLISRNENNNNQPQNTSLISSTSDKSATETSIASKLSVDKLMNYLQANNCYADKYRLIIWKYLLNLPNLQNVYQHHEQIEINEEWKDKLNDIQINDVHLRSKQRLLKILSLLSSWCKLCEHIDYLPQFIYPFTKLYQKNDIECFECIMFILCKYCSEWFVDYPDPSINILSSWVSILKHFDLSLYQHFTHHSINIEQNLWQIISNGFASFFNNKDWLTLWDHILTNPPLFFHLIPIAIILCCKPALYAMHTQSDIENFFGHQQQLYIKRIIDKTYFIIQNLPKELIPIFKPIIIAEADDKVEQYPIFNRYPAEAVAIMQQKTEKKLAAEQTEKEHQELLKALASESKEIAAKQAQFAQQQKILDYSYKQRLSALQSEEEQEALKRRKHSQQMAEKRLNSIGNIHKSMQEMINLQNSIKQLTINDLENQMHHHQKISEIDHDRIENEAALHQLEADTRQKLYDIELQQAIQAQTLKLQRLQQQFDQEQKIKQQLLEQTLSTMDNISKYKFIQQKNLLSAMNKLQNEYDTEQSIKQKLRLQSIINENKNKEIETENEMTNLMNEQLNVTQSMIEKQQKVQDIMKEQEDFEMNLMESQYDKFRESMQKQHENLLFQHKEELLDRLKQQQLKLNELSKKHRLNQFESMLKEQENNIKSDKSFKERQLQQTIDMIQKQIESLHEKEIELEMRDKEVLERNAFERVAKDAEEQIINQEKQKYAKMRESMLKEMQQKEERLRQRHDDVMNKLMKKREEQLIDIGQDAKRSVYNQEISDLQQEYDKKKKELQEMKINYDVRQDVIRQQLLEQANVTNINVMIDE